MAKAKRSFGDIFTTVVVSVTTLGLGALVIDWMKATGNWPKAKQLNASGDIGCDSCDPITEAMKKS